MDKNVFICGLPSAGKSTFVGSLFHYLDNLESDGYSAETPSNIAYIDALRDKWFKCEELDRTSIQDFHEIRLKISKNDSFVFDLLLPDLSGEIFKNLLVDREFTGKVYEWIKSSDTILFFIHPDQVFDAMRVDDINHEVSKITDESTKVEGDFSTSGGTVFTYDSYLEFEYSKSPTQVRIVDLIQIIKDIGLDSLKIGLIVSAWDLVPKKYKSAESFISSSMPLLRQFISCSDIKIKCFGLSATSGDLSKDYDKLIDLDASERIQFINEEQASFGYGQLLSWITDG